MIAALLAMVFWAPALFFGRVPIFRDFVNTFIPYKLYAARAFASGRVPLWAPEPSLGVPFLANYQSGVLYPLSAIVYLMPNPLGVGIYLWLHFCVAAIGMSALARHLGLSRAAGTFAGIVYVFGGYFISAAPWNHLTVASWLPLTVVAAMRLGTEAAPKRFLWLLTLLTLQALGGAPESFAQSVALAAGAAMVSGGATPIWRRAALAVSAAVLALGISGVQLCPTLEYFLETTRAAGLKPEEAMMKPLRPETLWTLIFPHRLDGGIVQPAVDGTLSLWWSMYIGFAPLLLVVVAVPAREAWLWLVALAGALVLAMGDQTPVLPFLHRAIPGLFASFRYPEKFLLTAHFSLAVLSAMGFSRIERWAARGRGHAVRLLAAGLCLITVADLWDVHWPSLLFSDWDSLLASAPPKELGTVGPADRIFGYEPGNPGLGIWAPKFTVGSDLAAIERYTWAEVAANVGLVYGVGFVNGLDSFRRRADQAFYGRLAASSLPECLRILRTFGVRFLMGDVPLDDPGLELLRGGGAGRTWIYRLAAPAPRAYLATSVQAVGGVGEALRWIAAPAFVPGVDAAAEGIASTTPAGGSVRIVEEEPERLVLEADTAGEALLVVNDSFFPGWLADVDGVSTDITRVNGLVRGVPLTAGKHRIVMRYAPGSLLIGLALSVATLLLVYPATRWLTRAPSRGRRLHAFRS